jgi:hypothetical protein
MSDLLEKCLGTTEVTEFDSLEDLEEYFERDNLIKCFGDDFNMTEEEIENTCLMASEYLTGWALGVIRDCNNPNQLAVEYTNDAEARVTEDNLEVWYNDHYMNDSEIVKFAKWIKNR